MILLAFIVGMPQEMGQEQRCLQLSVRGTTFNQCNGFGQSRSVFPQGRRKRTVVQVVALFMGQQDFRQSLRFCCHLQGTASRDVILFLATRK